MRRTFAVCARQQVEVRGLVYGQNGDPRELIRGHRWTLPKPEPGQVVLRLGMAAVNPADINVIQGVYPTRPGKQRLPGLEEPVYVGGNEGYAVVEEVSNSKDEGLSKGDWVVFGQPQMGTWKSHLVCAAKDVIKIRRSDQHSLTPVMASTLQVNPATAFRMLHDFVHLDPERDAVIQNAANSAVGQAVAQMTSRKLGIPSINLVRDRPDLAALKDSFASYGTAHSGGKANAHVFTYEALGDKESGARERIKEILGKRNVRLGLNALCGADNQNMTKFLGPGATLVTYGAMSKQPLIMPPGLIIFQDVSVRGFMMNKWYAQHGRQEREALMQTLVEWYEQAVIEPPPHSIVEFGAQESVEDMTAKAREAISKSMGGMGGQKVFFKFA